MASAPQRPTPKDAAESAPGRPWLKAYPQGLDWHDRYAPGLLSDMFDEAVAAHAKRTCIHFMGRRFSYAEIGDLADRAAKALQELGVGEGVKVGLLLPNTPTFVIFYFAILKAGGTVVNFNPLYSVEEIAFQARDSGTRIMVTLDLALLFEKVEPLLAEGVLDRAVVSRFANLLPKLKSVGMKLLRSPKLADPAASAQKDKLVLVTQALANDGRYRRPAMTPDSLAVLQYTGGTTGTPKGAMLSHGNLTVNVQQVRTWRRRLSTDHDRVLGVLPLFHVFAMTTVMNFGIREGMEIILVPKFDLIGTLKLITKLRPTMMPGVPTLYNAMIRHPHIKNFDLKSLEFCISGGAALPLEVKRGFEAICGCNLVEGYGLSETSPVATCNPLLDGKEGSIGLPLPGTEMSIRSLDDPAREMPIGEPGEICIAGPQVMSGYWNKPEDTRTSFVGRFFRTGDVGYMDEEGYIFIVDRIKDMINASGFKVYPRRIEDALYEHGGVEEVTVVGIPDPYRGEAPKAFVKLKAGAAVSESDLIHFLRGKLSKLEIPAEIEFRDELPKTMIGKLSKKELRAETRDRTTT